MLPRDPSTLPEDELRRWLEHLIKDGVEEGVQLDYKRELRLDANRGRRDLAQDISAFANQVGGTLLYGVDEDGDESSRPAPQGHGVEIDAGIEQRIQDILTDAVTPRLPRFGVPRVSFGDGEVLVVWAPQSYLVPHMVHAYGVHRF
jgi:predicted HTH transcriptional regulator